MFISHSLAQCKTRMQAAGKQLRNGIHMVICILLNIAWGRKYWIKEFKYQICSLKHLILKTRKQEQYFFKSILHYFQISANKENFTQILQLDKDALMIGECKHLLITITELWQVLVQNRVRLHHRTSRLPAS